MNAYQTRIYQANMHNGALLGVNNGASTWTYYPPPTGAGITAAPTMTSTGTVRGYVMEEDLSKYGQPLPPQPVGMIRYRFNGFLDTVVAAGGVIVSGAFAFVIMSLDSNLGFPMALIEKTSIPG